MERHASALKAARQAIKHRERNRQMRSQFKTLVKSLRTALEEKSKAEAKKNLPPLLNQVQRVLMKAASKNLIKKKTASRYISRLSAAVSRATA